MNQSPLRCWLPSMGLIVVTLAVWLIDATASAADPLKPIAVRVVQTDDRWKMLRGDKPYFIQGAGGGGPKSLLAECGGNSFRTWGVGPETDRELDEALKLGLTVTVGIWLGHKEHGFRYDDPPAVQKQFDDAKQAVLKYKDHPALLMWALGNEMEVHDDSPEMWEAIQELAKMVHEVDPAHPTMTVIAELGSDKTQQIHQRCPDIDVVGINTYGGGASVAERYRKAGGTKPFVITEYGPPGTWETKLNSFGAAPEKTSTEKAQFYRATYEQSVLGAPDLCLGSYAFTWGHKIEATATWFGLLLPDGSRLAAVDTLQELWTGKAPAQHCPSINKLILTSPDEVSRGVIVTAEVELDREVSDETQIEWALFHEQSSYALDGTGSKPTSEYPDAIVINGQPQVSVTMPNSGGVYRLYCFVHDGQQRAAVGSLPIKVKGPVALAKAAVPKLPLVVYADNQSTPPFAPSGWMGNARAISLEDDCTDNPHSGQTCMRVRFNQENDWGSVVWQHPANDWGDQPGGYDLTNAEKLVFWARGKSGGERVKFGYGLLGIEKKYHDSSKAEQEVTLTQEWKEYTIDLSEKELTRIKSGFVWNLAGQGQAVEFYLDDIEYR